MRKSSRRKLFLFGKYSLAMLPPKKWLTELGVKEGDEVELQLDKTKNRLIVNFVSQTNPSNKKPRSDKPTNPDDWQPIPGL